VYDCLFVLAWWRRFVSYDLAQGNRQCRQTLDFALCHPGASVSYSYLASQHLISEVLQFLLRGCLTYMRHSMAPSLSRSFRHSLPAALCPE
jgi:hypothetical protein